MGGWSQGIIRITLAVSAVLVLTSCALVPPWGTTNAPPIPVPTANPQAQCEPDLVQQDPTTAPLRPTAGVITEFPIGEPGSQPDSLLAAPDGNLWYIESSCNLIARMNPHGERTQFLTPHQLTYAHLVVTAQGDLWFNDNAVSMLGRVQPTGEMTEYPLPVKGSVFELTAAPDGTLWFELLFGHPETVALGHTSAAGVTTVYPLHHNSHLDALRVGVDGNLWFTQPDEHLIGRITTTGVMTEFTTGAHGAPSDLVVGADGNLWFTDASASAPAIGRITPTGVISTYPLPFAPTVWGGLTGGNQGWLWFTVEPDLAHPTGQIGHIALDGHMTLTQLPVDGGDPTDDVVDPNGVCWFNDLANNAVGRITESGVIQEFGLPTPNAAPINLVVGPDHHVWFLESAAVGRINRT